MVTNFENKVYALTKKVPRGKVTTYAEIAHAMGNRAYRAVGQALHRNPYAPKIPCHRVVRSDGSLGGFASGARIKERILAREGITIKKGMIENFDLRFTSLADSSKESY